MEEILEAYSIGKLQEFKNITLDIRKAGKTPDDVIKYIDEINNKRKIKPKVVRLCPICEANMLLIEVNTKPNNQIGGTAKTMLWCPNPDCNHTIIPEDK